MDIQTSHKNFMKKMRQINLISNWQRFILMIELVSSYVEKMNENVALQTGYNSQNNDQWWTEYSVSSF